jgi:hypothetical protein
LSIFREFNHESFVEQSGLYTVKIMKLRVGFGNQIAHGLSGIENLYGVLGIGDGGDEIRWRTGLCRCEQ